MCDTVFAHAVCTSSGRALFGKNSDRQRNEAQAVELVEPQEHPSGSLVRCTYISVPQVERTLGTLICRPFWMWGAEMGINEHGVVIGNEGLYSRISAPTQAALTGMDLVRLALERSRTAEEAVDIITSLLAAHGQGGNCGHLLETYYHNGFLIADVGQAYVLETVGREWGLQRIWGVRAISNQYSISNDFDQLSAGMPDLLTGLGSDGSSGPDLAQLLRDPKLVHVGSASGRRARATSQLEARSGELTLADILMLLRDHDPTGKHAQSWNPRDVLPYSLCVHAGSGDRHSQTTNSLAVDLHRGRPIGWVTGTAAPCISIFKPVMIGTQLSLRGPDPSDRFDAKTLWWAHERLHRAALRRGLEAFLAEIAQERDELEREFQDAVESVSDSSNSGDTAAVIGTCWSRAQSAESRWLEQVMPDHESDDSAYHEAWRSHSGRAGMPMPC